MKNIILIVKNYIINIFEKIKNNKVILYTICTCTLVLFCLALNIAFSSFTHTATNSAANITVKNMTYSMTINGKADTILASSSNDIDIFNVVLLSLNSIDSKYEIIYHVCSDENCETYVDKPDGLSIKYSSKSVDSINGLIESNNSKTIRIVTTNTTGNTIYIKLDVNAGYSYNTLALENLISLEYDESDVSVIAYVDGVLSSSFPTSNKYRAYVTCKVNNESSTATGKAIWDGTTWVVSISNVKTNNTRCNVNFNQPEILKTAILNDNGGESSIQEKTSFNSNDIITTNLGIFKMNDNYGTSYYYRGAVDNNWLKFGTYNQDVYYGFQSGINYIALYDTLSSCQGVSGNTCTKIISAGDPIYWRIIRINGDNSVRIIYNGVTAPTNNTKVVTNYYGTDLGTVKYNNSFNNNAYAGYVYTLGDAHGNSNSSTIKTYLENWYNKYLISYDSKIADSIFCSDRTSYINSGTFTLGGGTGTTESYYASFYRNIYNSPQSATFNCSNKLDALTKSDSVNGTAVLSQKVGLLTADEAIAAGMGNASSTNYLQVIQNLYRAGVYTSYPFFTMTPSTFVYYNNGMCNDGFKLFGIYNKNYDYSLSQSCDGYDAKPVINLSVTNLTYGIGTWDNPYVIE